MFNTNKGPEVEPAEGVAGVTRAFIQEPGFQESLAGDMGTPELLRAVGRQPVEDVRTLASAGAFKWGNRIPSEKKETEEIVMDYAKNAAVWSGISTIAGVITFFTGAAIYSQYAIAGAALILMGTGMAIGGGIFLAATAMYGTWRFVKGTKRFFFNQH